MSPSGREADLHQGQVEKLVSGGEGLLRLDGQVVFVPQVLPGELVEFAVTEKHKGFQRGILKKIVEPSPHRREPRCPVYGRCGGCDLMHAESSYQREVKRQIVQENFRRIARKELPLPAIHFQKEWNYRNRLQLHKDAQGRVGFKERSGNRIVAVPGCPVAAEGFSSLWPLDPALFLPGLERVNLFAPEDPNRGWFIQGRDKTITVDLLGKRIVFALEGFFQSNLSLLPALITRVLAFLTEGNGRTDDQQVLDLFCGCGLFGAFLADHFSRVTAVEENRAALEMAKTNIAGPLHEFIPLSLEDWLRKRRPRFDAYQAVVVDPPRTGLSKSVLEFLGNLQAYRLAYVSCNPDTLARDTAVLEQHGWTLHSLELYDFYPQTSHIEALGCFLRRS